MIVNDISVVNRDCLINQTCQLIAHSLALIKLIIDCTSSTYAGYTTGDLVDLLHLKFGGLVL